MRPRLRLLADNRKIGSFRADITTDSATIYLYDMIVSSDADAEMFGGVAPETFVKALNAITAPVIHLRINCPGGDVFAGRAMETAMRLHASKIIAHIDGYAASAATFLAMAADEIEMASGAFFMIHNAWACAMGDSEDLLVTASLLKKIDATMVETYAARTQQTPEQITAWMDAETWFTAQEAVGYGFADRITVNQDKATAKWNMAAYANAPQRPAEQTPENTVTIPAALSGDHTNIDDLRRRLQIVIKTA